jgi:hypothetical protein
MPRQKRDYASPTQAKSTIMAMALGVVGVFEFLECIEDGDTKIKAAKKAIRRTQLRGKAIKKAAKAVAPQIRKVEEDES